MKNIKYKKPKKYVKKTFNTNVNVQVKKNNVDYFKFVPIVNYEIVNINKQKN